MVRFIASSAYALASGGEAALLLIDLGMPEGSDRTEDSVTCRFDGGLHACSPHFNREEAAIR